MAAEAIAACTLKCCFCKKPISTSDAKRAVFWYRTPDGAEYMFCVPEGTPNPPAGSKILRTAHYKHYQASRTGEQTGQRVTYAPGVYEIDGLVESGIKLNLTVDQRRVSYLESQGFTHEEALEYVERDPNDWRDQDVLDI
jgi:hypothetical protein